MRWLAHVSARKVHLATYVDVCCVNSTSLGNVRVRRCMNACASVGACRSIAIQNNVCAGNLISRYTQFYRAFLNGHATFQNGDAIFLHVHTAS